METRTERMKVVANIWKLRNFFVYFNLVFYPKLEAKDSHIFVILISDVEGNVVLPKFAALVEY